MVGPERRETVAEMQADDYSPTIIHYHNNTGGEKDNGSFSDRLIESLEPSVPANSPTQFQPLEDIKWGYEVGTRNRVVTTFTVRRPDDVSDDPAIRCIKLFLDRGQKLPSWVHDLDTFHLLKKNKRQVKDAVADYLAKIRTHILNHLAVRFGQNFLDGVQTQFVLTVPAVWSDVAKEATLSAAKHAGFGPYIQMISEPEAAAGFTMKSMKTTQFNANDHIVVCDAGGGTVDLISYCITSTSPPILRECVVGSGDVCGAVSVNMGFEEHLKKRLGAALFDEFMTVKAKAWTTTLKSFEEHAKRVITSEMSTDFLIPVGNLPDDEAIGIEDGLLCLKSSEVRDIFDPVVHQVLNLIEGQVSGVLDTGNNVAAIMLVGGFGQSKYLFERVQAHFSSPENLHAKITLGKRKREPDDKLGGPIMVLQPPQAWTAIAQGAALHGVGVKMVTQRKSRYNYGIVLRVPYDPAKHSEAHRVWDRSLRKHFVNDTMRWFVQKNEDVAETQAIKVPVYRDWPKKTFPPANMLKWSTTLYANSDADPPVMRHGGAMTAVCSMDVDLSDVPKHRFKTVLRADGHRYKELHFSLEMHIESANLKFKMMIDNEQLGSVTAKFAE